MNLSRRQLILSGTCAGLASITTKLSWAMGETQRQIIKVIPSTNEQIPSIGMGTWITFNVGNSKQLRNSRVEVLRTFFENGGQLIDSSPMYGSSEEVVGYCLNKLNPNTVFSASKIWTGDNDEGKQQLRNSENLWQQRKMTLMQVHNLLNWKNHLAFLREMKQEGRIKYIGITTSHGRRHGDMARIMERQPIDFVQFTYNLEDREAESKLLPLAQDKGIAVLVNRPFQRGALIRKIQNEPLPGWTAEVNCKTWPQLLLKFVISHPAVTCAIPATSNPVHMLENMQALNGPLLSPEQRQQLTMLWT